TVRRPPCSTPLPYTTLFRSILTQAGKVRGKLHGDVLIHFLLQIDPVHSSIAGFLTGLYTPKEYKGKGGIKFLHRVLLMVNGKYMNFAGAGRLNSLPLQYGNPYG